MHRNMGYAYAEGDARGEEGPWGSRPRFVGMFRHPGELAIMILGFVLFWPVGLAVLFYYLWRKKMGCNWSGRSGWSGSWRPDFAFRDHPFSNVLQQGSGNAAFDDYRQEVLKRLDEERRKLNEEQMAFRAFMERLRRAKDQEEFDRFMAERNGGGEPHNGNGAPNA